MSSSRAAATTADSDSLANAPQREPALARRPTPRLAVAAAALAWAPIGFTAGVVAGARALTDGTGGGSILACALAGAGLAATLMGAASVWMPAKASRSVTLGAAGVSFALLIYFVRDFVADRMRQAETFDAAYERMGHFALRIESHGAGRRPFSALVFDATTRAYTAVRPGGWRCRGTGNRQHALALFRGVSALATHEARRESGGCATRVFWRVGVAQDSEPPAEWDQAACAVNTALLAAADAMVETTTRRASCRRVNG